MRATPVVATGGGVAHRCGPVVGDARRDANRDDCEEERMRCICPLLSFCRVPAPTF